MAHMQHMAHMLEAFRAALEAAQMQALLDQGYTLDRHRWDCRIKMGRKYANIDVAESGRYMVDLATSEIFGIKAYGVIHRGHRYGTLDTINQWDWRGYTASQRRVAA